MVDRPFVVAVAAVSVVVVIDVVGGGVCVRRRPFILDTPFE